MKARGNRTAWVRRAIAAIFATALLGLALAPGGANAAKVDNPSPPNFKAEITGGFLQLVTPVPLIVQLPMDFATYDPPLPNPTLTGTVTTNGAGYGVINIPQAGINFALYQAEESRPTCEHWQLRVAHDPQRTLEDVSLNAEAVILGLRDGGLPVIEVQQPAAPAAPTGIALPMA